LKDIKADSELTFDYAMECYGLKTQKCYCGEATCRNTIVAKDAIKPQNPKTQEELQLEQARRTHNRNRNSVISLLRYLTDFKMTKHLKRMSKRKVFLSRNLKAVHRLRLLQHMKIEAEFIQQLESTVETKKDEFGLYPWQRRQLTEEYKRLTGQSAEEVGAQAPDTPDTKVEEYSRKSKIKAIAGIANEENKQKSKEERKKSKKSEEQTKAKKQKTTEKQKPRQRKKLIKQKAEGLHKDPSHKPKKSPKAKPKEEPEPKRDVLDSNLAALDWSSLGVRKSKVVAMHVMHSEQKRSKK
jgi:hypothetical protein